MLIPAPTTTAGVVTFIQDVGVWSNPFFNEFLDASWFVIGFMIACVIFYAAVSYFWDWLNPSELPAGTPFRIERKQFFGANGAKNGEVFTERHYDDKFKFFKI